MELSEAQEKYKDVELVFSHYCKYNFYFEGVTKDGDDVLTSYGGLADDIYRYEVGAKVILMLGDNYERDWTSVSIYNNNTFKSVATVPDEETIFSWHQ
jgi:hypothetical protein